MKKIITHIICYSLLLLVIIVMGQRMQNLSIWLDNSINNEKAFAIENSLLKDKNLAFKFTIDQLEFYGDSLMLEMKKVANDNKIKDKNIKALQYQLEHFNKTDTLIIRDTIFKESGFTLDTCIIDNWNKSCLHLAYPGIITLNNEYKNEKYITLNAKREPIKPRKWFLPKWFTRKHTVIEVIVTDKNPYVTTPIQRYIEIINN